MRYNRLQLEGIAEGFRIKAGLQQEPPYDIAMIAKQVLPVQIFRIPGLNPLKIKSWLDQRNLFELTIETESAERIMHGFILMQHGSGLVFVNADDSDAEQRFTIAHEISHFLIDHRIPRQEIMARFGEKSNQFLDGNTTLDFSDQVLALTKRMPFYQRARAIEKDGNGSFRSWENFSSENEADILALELLAPRIQVVEETRAGQYNLQTQEFAERCQHLLEYHYVLPADVAKQYSLSLAYAFTNSSSLMNKLGYRRDTN